MKISERKQRLRARGVVPVPQETGEHKMAVLPTRAPAKAARTGTTGARKGAASQPPRQRWQPSPRYQMVFGAAYIIFSPLLLYESVVVRGPHSKNPAGAFDIILPIVFFFFGLWFVSRGYQAYRRQRAAGGGIGTPVSSSRQSPAAGSARAAAVSSKGSESPAGLAAGTAPLRKTGLARLFRGSSQ